MDGEDKRMDGENDENNECGKMGRWMEEWVNE